MINKSEVLKSAGNLFERCYTIQHNAITTVHHEMTVYEKGIFRTLLDQLSDEDPVDKVYHIAFKDIENLINTEISYEEALKSTHKLMEIAHTITEEKSILIVSTISSARYKKGTRKVDIRVDPEVRPYLLDLKRKLSLTIPIENADFLLTGPAENHK